MCEAERVQGGAHLIMLFCATVKLVIVHLHRHRGAAGPFCSQKPRRNDGLRRNLLVLRASRSASPCSLPKCRRRHTIAPAMPLTALTKNEIWDKLFLRESPFTLIVKFPLAFEEQ